MAFPANAVVESRSTGNSTVNGAFFVPGLGGSSTDYSQQDNAQLVLSDVVTTAGSAVITSATGGFTSLMVGNGLTIDRGGATDWYYVTAYTSTNQVTMDKNAIGGSQTGRSLRLGGAASLSSAGILYDSFLVGGNKVYHQGTFGPYVTNTPTYAVSGSLTNPIVIEGYAVTRGDGGYAIFASTAVDCLKIQGDAYVVKNIKGDAGNSGARALNAAGWSCTYENCWAISSLVATGTGASRVYVSGSNNRFVRCRADGQSNAGWGFYVAGDGNHFEHCESSGSTESSGFEVAAGAYSARFFHCISRDNTGAASDGFTFNEQLASLVNCDVSKNGRDGVRMVSPSGSLNDMAILANIFNRNGQTAGYEINRSSGDISANTGMIAAALVNIQGNAFYVTGLGKSNNLPPFAGDVTLSGDPFVDSGSGHDFTLNTTAGGGATVRATPLATAMPGGVGTDYRSLGALATGTATPPTAPSALTATAISGYRIDLTWLDNSSDEVYYFVERADNGGSYALLATLTAGTTSYSDLTVTPGNSYAYRVRGVN